jgi:SAM-dependent methyltransferase
LFELTHHVNLGLLCVSFADALPQFYDQADEGAENTYICVDRVTQALLSAAVQQQHSRALTDDAVSSSSSIVVPSPLPNLGALSLLASSSPSSSDGATPIAVGDEEMLLGAAAVADEAAAPSPLSTPSPSGSPLQREASPSNEQEDRSSISSELGGGSDDLSSLSGSPLSHSLSLASSVDSAASSCSSAGVGGESLTPLQQLHLSLGRPLRILDLGVGTGLASRPLFRALCVPSLAPGLVARASSPGEAKVVLPPGTLCPEIWGVDLSPGMLRVSSALPFAHLLAGDLNTDLSDAALYPGSPLTDPTAKASFDMVLSVGTTEFVKDPKAFLIQAAAFLRPGGLFAATFPVTQSSTYPDMSCVKGGAEQLAAWSAEECIGMDTLGTQAYRGWSVSAEEHVEYVQILAQKRR